MDGQDWSKDWMDEIMAGWRVLYKNGQMRTAEAQDGRLSEQTIRCTKISMAAVLAEAEALESFI